MFSCAKLSVGNVAHSGKDHKGANTTEYKILPHTLINLEVQENIQYIIGYKNRNLERAQILTERKVVAFGHQKMLFLIKIKTTNAQQQRCRGSNSDELELKLKVNAVIKK